MLDPCSNALARGTQWSPSKSYAGRLSGSTLKLIALIAPLGLDTLAVSVALGIAGLPSHRRLQLTLRRVRSPQPSCSKRQGAGLARPTGADGRSGANLNGTSFSWPQPEVGRA